MVCKVSGCDGQRRQGQTLCSIHHNAYVRDWRKKNRKAYEDTQQKYADTHDLAAIKHSHYLRNLKKRKKEFRQWAKNNKERHNAKSRRHKHYKTGAPGHYTETQWQDRLAFCGFRCYLCGVDWFSLDPFDRTVDHVIPLSQGGTNWPANLRPACRSCNSGKRDRTLFIGRSTT